MKGKESYNIAVVGATGVVGEVLLEVLAERKFPIDNIYAVASENSAGNTVRFDNKPLEVEALVAFDFSKVDIAFFSAGGAVSKEYVPIATKEGCVVIDNTSSFRYDKDVPLVIPEVNGELLDEVPASKIIANPNCSTIQMLVALKPIYDAVGISRINVATYQSVSGAGRRAIEELAKQTVDLLNGADIVSDVFPTQIAFNVIPHIDEFQENGYTREEMKMVWETQKIFADPNILVNPTAVRVPVFYSHAEVINIETKEHIDIDKAKELLRHALGVVLLEDGYPTPAVDSATHDGVYVGRLREDPTHPNGINLWVVSDNIRKGAALNSIQIAEALIVDKAKLN